MYNVFEHVNLSNRDLRVNTKLYSRSGSLVDQVSFLLDAGREIDVLVHDMEGRELDSYGKVCASHDGAEGDLDGRMVYYRTSSEYRRESREYDFAIAMPLGNGKTGSQFVPFNTFQPSYDIQDSENLVANWIQLTNLSNRQQSGRLRYWSLTGELLGVQRLSVQPGERIDFSGHQFGPSLVGYVEWQPDRLNAAFQLRNLRYLYDNPYGVDSFSSAFQLEGAYGCGDTMSVPLDTTEEQSAIIEISNVLDRAIGVTIEIYTADGSTVYSADFTLGAHESRHIITDTLLPEQRGLAVIKGSRHESLIATAMQYRRNDLGNIIHMYGVPARGAVGSVLRGTYNTFLGQHSLLVLMNPTSSTVATTLSMVRSDGIVILGNGVNPLLGDERLQGEVVEIPAHGVRVVDLNNFEIPDNYGVLTMQPEQANKIVAWIMRENEGQYVIPTPVRQ